MNILQRLNKDQRGTTMTEFVICLPIWITMMLGIINLGKLGMAANAVELTAQKNLWSEVIPLSDSELDIYMAPILAGGEEMTHIGELNVEGNPQRFVDTAELGLHGAALIAGGHWGESYERTVIFSFLADDLDDITLQPSDILGDSSDREFPHLLLNDTVQRDWGNIDSVEGMVSSFIASTGIVPALLAGNRYGVVFAEANRTEDLLVFSQTLNAGAHFDTLVPPSPVRSKEATDFITFGGAFLLAQTVENYQVMQRFGKSEWEGDAGDVPGGDRVPDSSGEIGNAREECENAFEQQQEDCQDEQDGLGEGEVLSEECQGFDTADNPCEGL